MATRPGEHHQGPHPAAMDHHGSARQGAVLRVPEAECAFGVSAGQHDFSVGVVEGDEGAYAAGVANQWFASLGTADRVPYADGSVVAAGGQQHMANRRSLSLSTAPPLVSSNCVNK